MIESRNFSVILIPAVNQLNEVFVGLTGNLDFDLKNKPKNTIPTHSFSFTESDFKKDLGPLGGVFTAMKWIKDNNKDYQWVSTFPTDSPFFKNKILKDFFNEIHPGESKLFFIKSNNTRHNIFGLWSLELMNKLEEDLNKGERKVEVWANSIGVKNIEMEFDNKDPFFNINTKEDLKKAIENL